MLFCAIAIAWNALAYGLGRYADANPDGWVAQMLDRLPVAVDAETDEPDADETDWR